MNTAVAIPAHWPSTADQSAPVIARSVQGSHRRADSKGPSSQRPALAVSSVEPVSSTPSTNATRPIASTTGITSGRRITRTAMSRIRPKRNAGSQRTNEYSPARSPIVPITASHCDSSGLATRRTWTPEETEIPRMSRSHPVPARNPPTTG